jgi:LacI family transcriptional regulator
LVTIKDVAREASVSVATVSRVLNGAAVVRAETARRIRDVAHALHYTPHSGARSLITRRTHTIGVLLPDLYGEFFSEIIRGIDEAARATNHHILVSRAYAGRSEIEEAIRAMRGRVDGVVVMSPDVDKSSLANAPANLPIILLCSAVRGGGFDSVTIQNYRGAREIISWLVSLGHRRIAIINGAPGTLDASERLRGYRVALKQAGIRHAPPLEQDGEFTEAGGYAATRTLIETSPRPTAIFAANDSMAIGALSALREAGLRVPEDVSVAGFDDIPLARYMDPPLTSVRVPIAELGGRAMDMLLNAIAHKNSHKRRRISLRTSLIVRSSCGAPVSERPPP